MYKVGLALSFIVFLSFESTSLAKKNKKHLICESILIDFRLGPKAITVAELSIYHVPVYATLYITEGPMSPLDTGAVVRLYHSIPSGYTPTESNNTPDTRIKNKKRVKKIKIKRILKVNTHFKYTIIDSLY